MENFGQKNDNALQLLFGLYDCLFRYCQRVGVVVWLLTSVLTKRIYGKFRLTNPIYVFRYLTFLST